jgi:hypothetical protein
MMKLQTIHRKQTKARLALQGPAGAGKTMSSLLLAYGLTGNWQKIAIIDTEQNSASFHSDLGDFNTVQLGTPYTTDRYIEAVELCELAGIEAIIIDSISPEWIGELGCLHQYGLMEGDTTSKWAQVMPDHNIFMNTIHTSSAHVIATVRTAEGRVLQEKGYAHHFMTALRLDEENYVHVIKDRTNIFKDVSPLKIDATMGTRLYDWSVQGELAVSPALQKKIDLCASAEALNEIEEIDLEDIGVTQAYIKRRIELEGIGYWRHKQVNGKVISIAPSAEV